LSRRPWVHAGVTARHGGVAFSCMAAALMACEAPPQVPAVPQLAARDSAGVRLVEHNAPSPTVDVWVVSTEPELSIGTLDGSGPEAFGRVATVAETGDGVIVVVDALALELRAFDASGRHVWTVGGRGEGPGQFGRIDAVAALEDDSIAAFDGRNRRVSVFTPEGRFGRDERIVLPSSLGVPALSGFTRAGVLVGLAPVRSLVPAQPGPYRTTATLMLFHQAATEASIVSTFPEGDFVRMEARAGPVAPRIRLLLGRSTQLAVGTHSIALTTQERFEILRYAPTGMLREIVRVSVPVRAVDAERYADAAGGRRQQLLPDFLPAVSRLRVDAADRIWVEEYVAPYEDRAPRWWIFAPGGELVALAAVPAGFSPLVIAVDHVTGVVEDSLGVQYAERRRLQH